MSFVNTSNAAATKQHELSSVVLRRIAQLREARVPLDASVCDKAVVAASTFQGDWPSSIVNVATTKDALYILHKAGSEFDQLILQLTIVTEGSIDGAMRADIGAVQMSMGEPSTANSLSSDVVFTTYLRVIERFFWARDPFRHNPYTHVLLSIFGRYLTREQLEAVHKWIEDAKSRDLETLLNEVMSEHKLAGTTINRALTSYFAREENGSKKQFNLHTVIVDAINFANDGNFKKYSRVDPEQLKNKTLALRLATTANGPHTLTLDVIEAKRSANTWIFVLQDPRHLSLFTMDLSLVVGGDVAEEADTGKVTLTRQDRRDLGRWLRATKCGKLKCILIQQKNSWSSLLPTGSYKLTKSDGVLSKFTMGMLGGQRGIVYEFKQDRKEILRIEVPPEALGDVKVLQEGKLQEGGERYTVDTYMQMLNDGYEVIEDSIVVDNRTVTLADVQIKTKLSTPDEIKLKLRREFQESRQKLISFCAQEEGCQIYIDALLDRLHRLAVFSEGDADDWLQELPQDMRSKFDEVWSVFAQIDTNDVVKSRNLLLKEVAEAVNSAKLFATRQNAVSEVEIMSRLTTAFECLREIETRDLILFTGDTGAGKSTSVDYFLGAELEYASRGAFPVVKISDADKDAQDIAGIAGCMSISETTFVKGHEVRKAQQQFWDGIIDFEYLRLTDLPGSRDTRGFEYDLTASISISECINSARTIKGIILVLDYRTFLATKGTPVVDAVDRICDMFASSDALTRCVVRSCIHIIVNHCTDPSHNKRTFEYLINEYLSDATKEQEKARHMDTKRYEVWNFIKDRFAEGRVLFMDIQNIQERNSWLVTCASKDNLGIPKECFARPLDRFTVQTDLGNILQSSLYIWSQLALWKFQETIPAAIKALEKLLESLGSHLDRCVSSIASSHDICKDRIVFIGQMRKDQEELRQLIENNTPITQWPQKYMEIYFAEIDILEKERSALVDQRSGQQELSCYLERKLCELRADRAAIEDRIKKLTERNMQLLDDDGNVDYVLARLDKVAVGARVSTDVWEPGVAAEAVANVREITAKDIKSAGRTFIAGTTCGVLRYDCYIERSFDVVPDTDQDLFFRQVSVSSRNRIYTAKLVQHNCKICTEHPPNASSDRKRLIYLVDAKYGTGEEGIPYFQIVHSLPKTEVFKEEIRNNTSEISTHNNKLLESSLGKQIDQLVERQQESLADGEETLRRLEDLTLKIGRKHEEAIMITQNLATRIKDQMENSVEVILTTMEYAEKCAATMCTVKHNILTARSQILKNRHELTRLAHVIVASEPSISCFSTLAKMCCGDTQVQKAIRARNRETSDGPLQTIEHDLASFATYYTANFSDIMNACRDLLQRNSLCALRKDWTEIEEILVRTGHINPLFIPPPLLFL
jgi:hypothetical protein